MSVKIRLRITHQEKPSLRPAIRKSPAMKPDSSCVAGVPSRRNIKNPTPKPVKQPRAQKRSNSFPAFVHQEISLDSRMKTRSVLTWDADTWPTFRRSEPIVLDRQVYRLGSKGRSRRFQSTSATSCQPAKRKNS